MKKLFDLTRVAMAKGALIEDQAAGVVNCASVDTLNFRHGLLYADIVATGNATYSIKLQQSEDDSNWTDVPVAKFALVTGDITDEAALEVVEVTTKSLQRYVRAVVTIGGVGAVDAAFVYALGDKDYTPDPTQFLSK